MKKGLYLSKESDQIIEVREVARTWARCGVTNSAGRHMVTWVKRSSVRELFTFIGRV